MTTTKPPKGNKMSITTEPEQPAIVVVNLVTYMGGAQIRRPGPKEATLVRVEVGECLPPDVPPAKVAHLVSIGLVTPVKVELNAEQVAQARAAAATHLAEKGNN